MVPEVVDYLGCRPGQICVDGTLGGAGHAVAICEHIMPGGLLIGIDQDKDAIEQARDRLKPYAACVHLVRGNFVQLPELLTRLDVTGVDGILVDLGVSLHQLKGSGRGFSFQKDEVLDMRMDEREGQTAEQLVNHLTASELKRLFKELGEERHAGAIAQRIVKVRQKGRIRTTGQLAKLVREAVPARAVHAQKIHPATRVFMALRIAVNRELERLERFMDTAVDWLNPSGRLCVLSFHSLEDRIVKRRLKALAAGCTCPPQLPRCVCGRKPQVRILTRKVVRPGQEEVERNPMSRSTRLRAAEKL
jgi:16S rRNA (cytosine1402-N4)-methyltransferase